MSKAFKCDICGELYEGSPKPFIHNKSIEAHGIGISVKLSKQSKHSDKEEFCEECRQKMIDVFKTVVYSGDEEVDRKTLLSRISDVIEERKSG